MEYDRFKKIIFQIVQNNLFMCLFFLITGSFICSKTLFDFSWDFANYHYYNAFAFFNNRLNYDIVPSSINTFFNPLMDLPFYLILQYFNESPRVVFAIQGIWFSLLLFVFYKFVSLFFSN